MQKSPDERRTQSQVVYSKNEETMNVVTHIVGAAICLILGAYMIIKASMGAVSGKYSGLALGSVIFFTAALLVQYIMSAVYHGSKYGSAARTALRRIDHSSICFLIAGSYAPYSVIGLIEKGTEQPADAVWGTVIISVVILLAITVIVFSALDIKKLRIFNLIAYVVMGWLIILRVYHLYLSIGLLSILLLFGGGVMYTAGVPFYKIKKIPFNHAIFHLFVVAGSVLMICGVICIL